jgi:hypothetical protein
MTLALLYLKYWKKVEENGTAQILIISLKKQLTNFSSFLLMWKVHQKWILIKINQLMNNMISNLPENINIYINKYIIK